MVENIVTVFVLMIALFVFGDAISITWPANARNSLRMCCLGIFGLVSCMSVLNYYPNLPMFMYIVPPILISGITIYGIKYEVSKSVGGE
jgi:riboflavin transporter FmnP